MAAPSAANACPGVTVAPAAARSVAGNAVAAGWLAQLTPMPMATTNSGVLSPSIRIPASLASPSKRSFGHFSLRPAASAGAHCGDRVVHGKRRHEGQLRRGSAAPRARAATAWRRDCPAARPTGWPRRPRPALWLLRRHPERPALAGARKRQRLGVGRAERVVGYVPDPPPGPWRRGSFRCARSDRRASEQRLRRRAGRAQERRRIDEEQEIEQAADAKHEP